MFGQNIVSLFFPGQNPTLMPGNDPLLDCGIRFFQFIGTTRERFLQNSGIVSTLK